MAMTRSLLLFALFVGCAYSLTVTIPWNRFLGPVISLTLRPGDSVTWTWNDLPANKHGVISIVSLVNPTPNGVSNSGTPTASGTFTINYPNTGTFFYKDVPPFDPFQRVKVNVTNAIADGSQILISVPSLSPSLSVTRSISRSASPTRSTAPSITSTRSPSATPTTSSVSCFLRGTQVAMADGTSKAIETVQRDEVVYNGDGERSVVIRTNGLEVGRRYLVGFNDIEPFATQEHPFALYHYPNLFAVAEPAALVTSFPNVYDRVVPLRPGVQLKRRIPGSNPPSFEPYTVHRLNIREVPPNEVEVFSMYAWEEDQIGVWTEPPTTSFLANEFVVFDERGATQQRYPMTYILLNGIVRRLNTALLNLFIAYLETHPGQHYVPWLERVSERFSLALIDKADQLVPGHPTRRPVGWTQPSSEAIHALYEAMADDDKKREVMTEEEIEIEDMLSSEIWSSDLVQGKVWDERAAVPTRNEIGRGFRLFVRQYANLGLSWVDWIPFAQASTLITDLTNWARTFDVSTIQIP